MMKKTINVHLACNDYLSFQHVAKKRTQVMKNTTLAHGEQKHVAKR